MNVPGRHVASPAPAFSGLGPRPAAFRDKVPHASTRAKGPRPQVAVCHGLDQFQSSHAFLISVIITIGSRLAIMELRRRIEKPVMDELGNRVAQEVTPDADQIDFVQWAKLAACIGLDLAGDASELIPFLGEFTDVAFAPVEAVIRQRWCFRSSSHRCSAALGSSRRFCPSPTSFRPFASAGVFHIHSLTHTRRLGVSK